MDQTERKTVNQFLFFLGNNNPVEIAGILADSGTEHEINDFLSKLQAFQSNILSAERILKVRKANDDFVKIVKKNNDLVREMGLRGHISGRLFGEYLKVV